MSRYRLLLACMAAFSAIAPAALAQPADCPSAPAPTDTIPLWLHLKGLPGVPKGVSGEVALDVPAPPPGGTVCGTQPRPPRDVLGGSPGDVLAGPPGDVLRGDGSRDLLSGRNPRVQVETK